MSAELTGVKLLCPTVPLSAVATGPTVEQLLDQRQKVSVEAANGDAKAMRAWNDLTFEINKLRSQAELRDAARVEQQRREAEAEKQRLEAERLATEAELSTAQDKYNEQQRGLESQIKALAAPVEEVMKTGKTVYGLAAKLGRRMRWDLRERIATAIDLALFPTLHPAVDYVPPTQRESLVAEDGPRGSFYQPGTMTHKEGSAAEEFFGVPADGGPSTIESAEAADESAATVITAAELDALMAKPGETQAERKARHRQIDQIITGKTEEPEHEEQTATLGRD